MLTVGPVEAVIAIGPTDDKSYCAEFAKLVVNSVDVEPAHVRKLTHISVPTRCDKDRLQQFCPHLRK